MYGALLVAISSVFSNPFGYSIGLGLFVDEFAFLVMQGKTHKDNYSLCSLAGTALLITLVFVFREQVFRLVDVLPMLHRLVGGLFIWHF